MRKILFLMWCICTVMIVQAKTIYVKSGETGTGESWAKASGSVANAIKSAASGDAIYVGAGVYTESWGNLKAGVSIYGGFKGTEQTIEERVKASVFPYDFVNETVITVANSPIITAATVSLSDANSLWIDGFTFKGCTNTVAIFTLRGGMNLRNCRFMNNTINGTGTNNLVAYNISKVSDEIEAHATVVDCLFEGNTNHQNQNILSMSVPKINYNGADNCFGVVERCIFRNNLTDLASGSTNANILLIGGDLGLVSVRNSLFYNNSSKQATISSAVKSEIVNCLIYNNTCGVNHVLLAGKMYNSLVVNNTSRFCFNSNDAKIYNTAVVGNKVTGLGLNGTAVTTPEAKNCAIEKALPAQGIYDANLILETVADAQFIRPTSFMGIADSEAKMQELLNCDWHLQVSSPLINSGLSRWFKGSDYGVDNNKDYTNTHVRYYDAWTDMNAYEADKYRLAISVEEGGSVLADQSGYYVASQELTLSVVPDAGFRIKEWKDETGAVLATTAKFTYTMPSLSKTLTASFLKTDQKYKLTVLAGNGGTITDVSGDYFADQAITLVASPSIGYRFVNWTDNNGAVLSTEASFTYTMPLQVATVTANFQLKTDDVAGTHSFDFEGLTVNKQWSATDGTLSISDDRSQTGTQSLCWTTSAQKDNVLKIVLDNDYQTQTLVTCYFNLYNPTAIRGGVLEVKFYNKAGTLVRVATQSMDFVGWREFERRYGIDFKNKSAISRVASIEITLTNPKNTATKLYFDQVNLEGKVSDTKFVSDWCAPDAALFASETLLRDYAYRLDETLPYKTPTDSELADLTVVKERYNIDPRAGDIESVRKFVKDLMLTRNADGSIKGAVVPIRNQALLTAKQLFAVCTRIETLGYAAKSSEADKQLLNDYLDYVLDQGILYRISLISTSDYTAVRNTGIALTRALGACQTERQSVEWANLIYWAMAYGQIYQPNYLTNQNSDIIYNYIEYFTTTSAHIKDPIAAIRELKGMKRYLDRAGEITPGGYDLLKPDGTGFHHSTHYPNYMYAYRGWVGVWNNLRGTAFRPEAEAYESFKKAAIAMCLMATRGGDNDNYLANSLGGRNPFNGNQLMLYKSTMDDLSAVGSDVYGGKTDTELEALKAYMFDANSTSTQYDGYYAFNWSPAGVYRHNNWVATMRAPTTKFWGSEIYISRNSFGRYQSHGTLEVLYNNQATPSGYPANKNESGWDWNVVPGGTTVHYTNWTEMMPGKNVTQRFDQFAMSKDFSGALPFEGSGVFASDFDQIDTWSVKCFAPTGLAFKKSVFAFEGKLISLGTNITSTQSPANTSVTATNLFQSFKPATGPNIKGTVISQNDKTTEYESGTWMVTPEGTGYYVPEGNDEVSVFYGSQSSPIDDATNLTSPGKAIVAKAYINHGITPSDKNYHFVVIPGTNAADMQSATAEIGKDGGSLYTINSQDATLHSLTYKPLKTTAYAFFEAKKGLAFGHVLAAGSEMLLMEKTVSDTKLAYGVCNPNLRPEDDGAGGWKATPTHTSITVKGVWSLASDRNENITVANDGTNTTVTLTLTDGLPVYFVLDKSGGVGINSEAVSNSQVWAEKGTLHVASEQLVDVVVFNTTGVQITVSSRALNHNVPLSPGVYVVRLQDSNSIKTSKIVIQ